jgi:hypothetical protein
MKLAAYFPLLVTAILFPHLTVFAQAELEDSRDDLSLISKPDPALAGIEPMCVVVVSHNTEPNRAALLLKSVKRKTETDLKKAGIEVFIVPDENNPPELPELRISVDIFRPDNSGRCFLHVQTSLAKLVYLDKDLAMSIKTDVWKIGPAMEVTSLENMQTVTMRMVSKQVAVFIHACVAANNADKSSGAGGTKTAAAPVAKSGSDELHYVASKNGKAFHIPTCRSAARIKPENLVTYNTREDALAAGKNPCKQCKP